jgi:diguanylate cyclase (GGDEF)-like protein
MHAYAAVNVANGDGGTNIIARRISFLLPGAKSPACPDDTDYRSVRAKGGAWCAPSLHTQSARDECDAVFGRAAGQSLMNEQLIERIRQCPNLPSLPAIAMQVLELAQKADVDIAEIARIICKDPAMSSKLLRTVNSSFYGRSQHVSTISHALVILGLQSVKTLVLGFSLVTNLSKNKGKGFKHITYWRRSIFAATAARTLAAKIGLVQQEEAFLTALLKDIGMLVLDQVLEEQYGEIHSKISTHQELLAAERATLGMTHADVGGVLAEQWKLPPLLSTPIAFHHTPEKVEDPALRKLTELVGLAGRCADVFVNENAAESIATVRQTAQQNYGLAESEVDALLDEIGKKTKEVASLFEINIGASAANYEAILKKANEALVEITLQTQQQATQLKQQTQNLEQQNLALKKQATTDGLTGLSNRARFDLFLAEHFAAHRASGKPLSMLLMDVDKFKSVNDKYGHPAGDKVLKVLGALLGSAARAQDLAARYGGEELVLVLPGTGRATAAAIAESIRRAIAARPVAIGSTNLPITASIGVACLEPNSPFREPAHLLKAADLAVYNAKRSGRNCVRVFALAAKPSPAAA